MLRICLDCNGKGYRPGELVTDKEGIFYFRAEKCKACSGKGTFFQYEPIPSFISYTPPTYYTNWLIV